MSETARDDRAGLTITERNALEFAPFNGLRPGDNFWSEVCFVGKPDADGRSNVIFDGDVVEQMRRAGLLSAEPLASPETFGRHSEVGDCQATHRYHLTKAGRAALRTDPSQSGETRP